MKAEDKITKAKVNLLMDQPWFGQLSCYITPIERPGMAKTCPGPVGITANGDLYYDPEWISKIKDDEVKAVLCHEILHLAFQHPFRIQTRDPRIWNIAADLKVNLEIKEIDWNLPEENKHFVPNSYGEWKSPDGKIVITDIGTKTTEQIYEELFKKAPKCKNPMADLIQGMGRAIAKKLGSKNLTSAEVKEIAQDWMEKINTANAQFKGSIPAGLERELSKLEYPELPWMQIIRQRFKALSKKLSWSKVNKKYLPLYFPGNVKNVKLRAVIAIDTSGSMSQAQLTKAVSEIWGLAMTFRHFHLWLVTCDAEVWETIEMKNGNKSKLFDLKMRGGGGTDFRPVFKLIKEKFRNNIDCLVFFTDLYGDFPDKKPWYPVYWISDTPDETPPFGQLVKLKEI